MNSLKKQGSIASAGMLDEDGKAMFGTPGPGTYDRVGAFGETVVYGTAPNHSFGFKSEGAQPFISDEHAKVQGTQLSPGPAYNPTNKMVQIQSASYSFGTADRGAERGRFISDVHCRENLAATTPGPGTYRLKHGKGIARTIGDAQTVKFPTAAQREFIGEKEMLLHPGPGAHDPPAWVGDRDEHRNPTTKWEPKFSFAPHGSIERGSVRSKSQEHAVFVSEQHAKTNTSTKLTPGPGEYDMRSPLGGDDDRHLIDSCRRNDRHPAYSFDKAKKTAEATSVPYISEKHVGPDAASPGPKYELGSKILDGAPGLKFGTGRRFHQPEKGGNKAGPVISHLHADQTIGANSPGPAQYKPKEGKGIHKTMGDAPMWKFGTAQRLGPEGKHSQENDMVPGPGAYQLPKNTAELSGGGGMYTAGPTYSVSSCLRTSIVTADPDEPAPGAYETDKGIASQDIRKRRAPSSKFGKCTNRSSFMAAPNTPGPGNYSHSQSTDVGHAPKYSFGMKSSMKQPSQLGGSKYISKLHSKEYMGTQSPGPGSYQMAEGKGIAKTLGDAPNAKFGSERRGEQKIYIGPEHVKVEAGLTSNNPGPGSYNPNGLAGTSNRYNNNGGCSFGTSTRPPLANVKF
mmetsp:Transcript_2655/g.3003  ORF Transcript_2655/g.3003 Transcript_2655/m.3003 type:complete len:625 (-) Transcript_2655:337-2211(-)|eukprot:CAMPEP_0197850324 /NCGR_PEP_ID=MMETSP1438-20131217/15058_1 /TAXON_ID=1461541 /ORGANISM="Pterosperma sp., Strain CCMP1384" /LENGTH=624 /DNA_ID=CAMNT_0043463441 /DNA_START=210 /DNA_END=2084 /DNA_ORIENTATION=+